MVLSSLLMLSCVEANLLGLCFYVRYSGSFALLSLFCFSA